MKTRIVHTRFWRDNFICTLSAKEKLLFIYLLTNENVNLIGIYELPDRYIKADLDITQPELDEAKKKFAGKIVFKDGWVKLVHHERYNSYQGEKIQKAIERERKEAPEYLLDGSIDTSIDTSMDTLNNHKSLSKTINQKSEYASIDFLKNMPEAEVIEFTEKYEANASAIRRKAIELANYCEGHGKTYKNYKAMLNNACIKDFGMRKPVYKPPELPKEPEMTPEQRAASQKKIDEIRAKLGPRFSFNRTATDSKGQQNKKQGGEAT